MNKKNILLIIFFIFLSSCTYKVKLPTDLAKKPKMTSLEYDVLKILNENIENNINLILPLKSNNLKSSGEIDFDNDEENEIYIFYKNNDMLGVMILKKNINNKLSFFKKFETIGNEIEYANFIDLNGDGVKEIVLGTSEKSGIYKNLVIFDIKKSETQIFSQKYSDIIIDKFEQSENNKILLFTLNREEFSNVKLISYIDDIEIKDEVNLDPYINGYYSIKYDYINSEKKEIIIDFKIGTKSASNILKINNNKIIPVFKNNYNKTIKSSEIISRDINNDGIIDIATNYFFMTEKKNINLYKWINFDIDSLNENKFYLSYISKNNEYIYVFSDAIRKMFENKLITIEENTKGITFYYNKNFNNSEMIKIMSIIEVNNDELNDFLDQYYKKNIILLKEGLKNYYAYFFDIDIENIENFYKNIKLIEIHKLFLDSIRNNKMIFFN